MCGKNTGCGEKKADRLDMYYEDRTCHREKQKDEQQKTERHVFSGNHSDFLSFVSDPCHFISAGEHR